MWNSKEYQISKFIEADDLVLPRFQRKSTWNARKDFYLALSFFRGLPLGTVVIKDANGQGGVSGPRYLLDGRQRWEALKGMQNPERLYDWATAALGVRQNWSDEKLVTEFDRSVEDYFGADPSEEALDQSLGPEPVAEAGDEEDQGDSVEEIDDEQRGAVGESPSDFGGAGLDELRRVLLLVHPKRKDGSRFTKAFDFMGLVDGLDYLERDAETGRVWVEAAKLRDWISYRCRQAAKAGLDVPPSQEQFLEWLTSGTPLGAEKDAALRNRIKHHWGTIQDAISVVSDVEHRLERSVIPALVLSGTRASDDAKIFEIINTGGTKLTAAEVLSANPLWNQVIRDPHPALIADSKALYEAMGISYPGSVYRWDAGATLLSRVSAPGVFGDLGRPLPNEDVRRFERRITLGFQLMSGWHQGRIAKDAIEALPREIKSIAWGTAELEALFNDATEVAFTQDQFKYWSAWGLSLIDLTSDAVALAFILTMAVDWDRRGRPKTDGAELKTYRRNARVLLDRLIFEYCMGSWRGSSDSRIALLIQRLRQQGAEWAFDAVPEDQWERLVTEVTVGGTIASVRYTDRTDVRIRLLLAYRNVVKRLWPEGLGNEKTQLDHIIPTSEFTQVPAGSALKPLQHHIGNLALLPPATNLYKSDQRLDKLDLDSHRYECELISRYEDVEIADFGRYSQWTQAADLVDHRNRLIREDLTETRSSTLN